MQKNSFSSLQQAIVAIILGIGLSTAVIAGIIVNFQLSYKDQIYPGVHTGMLDLSGISEFEATLLLDQVYSYPEDGIITLKDGTNTWEITPSQAGLFLNPEQIARNAYTLGRTGTPFNRFLNIFSMDLFF